MTSQGTIVYHYLGEFLAGHSDDAFHSLIEAGPAVIPELIDAYEGTDDMDTKVFVIEVISEFRLDSSLYFIRHALRRGNPTIWKSALTGMVMAESSEAVDAMNHVLASVGDTDKRAWIEQAISDTNASINDKQNQRIHNDASDASLRPRT